MRKSIQFHGDFMRNIIRWGDYWNERTIKKWVELNEVMTFEKFCEAFKLEHFDDLKDDSLIDEKEDKDENK